MNTKSWRLVALWMLAALAALSSLAAGCEEAGAEQKLQITSGGSDPVKITVPAGAASMVVVLDGAPRTQLVQVKTITSPSGKVIFDFDKGITTNRADTTDGLYSVLVPVTPDIDFESGDWQLTFLTDGSSFEGKVKSDIKTTAGGTTLDLNLFFSGELGITAETAKTDARFQAVMTDAAQLFGKAGISFGAVSYEDLAGDAAQTYSVIDSVDGDGNELDALFKLSANKSNRALNFFFVADIKGNNQGFNLLGRAGGVPGPASFHGTHRSGVVVSLADFIAAATGDDAAQEKARKTTRIIMSHEAGHYLGLFHTTERNGLALGDKAITGQDPIDDTPLCADDADANADGRLAYAECTGADGDNLMFHDPQGADPTFSAKQAKVLQSNPLVK
jgi:hypothetical protein